jgi:hypothetical protein
MFAIYIIIVPRFRSCQLDQSKLIAGKIHPPTWKKILIIEIIQSTCIIIALDMKNIVMEVTIQ